MRAPFLSGNFLFRVAVHGLLWLLVLFLAGVLLSLFPHIRWADFTDSLRDPESLFAIRLTALCVTASTVACVLIGIPAAYALSRYRIPAASLVDTVLDLPIVMPQLIAGIALLMFLLSPVGRVLEAHVLGAVDTPMGITLAIFFPTVSLAVRSMKAGFDSVDRRYEQVARTLGCTEWQAFYKVAFPLARNGLIAGAVLTWAYSLGIFGSVLMFSGATRGRTDVMPIAIFLNMTTGKIAAGLSLTAILLAIGVGSLIAFKRLGGKAALA
jgi:molybdate transport system permease protein